VTYKTDSDWMIGFIDTLYTELGTAGNYSAIAVEIDSFLDNNYSNDLLCSFITPRHGQRRKHSLSIVEKTCLLIRCLAMDVLLFRSLTLAGMCLPSRCLAMGLYATIFLIFKLWEIHIM
jgi:hypothetical protein